ncbi:MAG: ExeA family protein [Gemmataceae bacterium]
MHAAPFGLTRRPFAPSPDTDPYPATGFEEAVAALLDGLADGETFLTLTGVPGVGKSLAGRAVLERLGGPTVYVNTAVGDPAGLLQAVLFDLGLPHEGRAEAQTRLAVVEHLLTAFGAGKRTVLILDEAHLLSPATLEELRVLGNLEGAVQIVLIGQPGLIRTLQSPALASLRQRVAVRAVLEPLGVEEAADYVLHHLRVAGAADGLVGEEALGLLAKATAGVPRLLNQAMHRALRMAAAAGAAGVDAEVMIEALAALGLSAEADESADPYRLFAPAHPA